MIKKISILIIAVILTSCTTIKEKMPKMERKACTGENKTLADVWCKKKQFMKKVFFYFLLSIFLITSNSIIVIAKEDCSKINGFKRKLECKIRNNPINQSKTKQKISELNKSLENKTLADFFWKKEN